MIENQSENVAENAKSLTSKNPITYAIIPKFEKEIREYVDYINQKTGLPKQRIVSDLLLDSIRRAKKICPLDSDNSENSEELATFIATKAMQPHAE